MRLTSTCTKEWLEENQGSSTNVVNNLFMSTKLLTLNKALYICTIIMLLQFILESLMVYGLNHAYLNTVDLIMF